MTKKYNFLIFTGIFVLSIIFVFCAGYYRKNINKESGRFNIEITADNKMFKADTAAYDIQNENLSRKMFEAHNISIIAGHGSKVITGKDPIWLYGKAIGLEGTAKLMSENPIFDRKSECCIKPLMPW